MAQYKQTIDQKEIISWVEKYKGKPAIIDAPDATADKIGLRIDFPGKKDGQYISEGSWKDVTWAEFFKVFNDHALAFRYLDKEGLTDPSLYYKFISRHM